MTGRYEPIDHPAQPGPEEAPPTSVLACEGVATTMARQERQLEAYRLFGRLYRCNGAEAKDTREALRRAEECT